MELSRFNGCLIQYNLFSLLHLINLIFASLRVIEISGLSDISARQSIRSNRWKIKTDERFGGTTTLQVIQTEVFYLNFWRLS